MQISLHLYLRRSDWSWEPLSINLGNSKSLVWLCFGLEIWWPNETP